MNRLRTMLGCHVDPATLRWVITVPASWEEAAKDTMRSAAMRAGRWTQHAAQCVYVAGGRGAAGEVRGDHGAGQVA